jgi:indolepyruvate ferredoxin oxidoreductase
MSHPTALKTVVTLDDKYTLTHGHAYLTGTQAVLRLLITQRLRDAAAGLSTAAFVSGYRGSPVGGIDLTLYKAGKLLAQHAIKFNPGINEELAATSVWGSQQAGLYGDATVDGVLGLWYGKGPGVDRCPDVWRHASGAGTSPLGGVLAIAGDDTAAKSSTYPNQSDAIFQSVGIPLFYPASVQEMIDFGIHGYAMSRFCGAWVGMKAVTDVIESAAVVDVSVDRVTTVLPLDFSAPKDGLHIRWPDTPHAIGARVWEHKIPAALAYARANRLDKVVFGAGSSDAKQTTVRAEPVEALVTLEGSESTPASPSTGSGRTVTQQLGIITAGKPLGDTLEALRLLGLDETACAAHGISVFQVAMIWPLEPQGLRNYAQGIETLLVVEELRPTLESQVKEALYGSASCAVHGKDLLPIAGELSPLKIAHAIAALLPIELKVNALKTLAALTPSCAIGAPVEARQAWFCSGCPHSTSTKVPEGSRALAGIGCHYMAMWMDRDTATFTQMGGEGTPWIGAAPFSKTPHVFANLGDGTYFHSGILAVRASIAAKVNITYKILYNDAVSMTGGQPHDGQVTAHSLAAQMLAEGAVSVCVVSYQPERFESQPLPAGVPLHPRIELDAVQRALREVEGCTVIIYDQPCATEKRRKQKTNPLPVAQRSYAMINPAVCEGCGDCSTQSNCLSVEPLDTPLGRKRKINQSSCNTDMSCVKGFCPSFVTVTGVALKKPANKGLNTKTVRPEHVEGQIKENGFNIPQPAIPTLTAPLGILVAGVGGTGVVTIGQLLGMAAHLEGKGCSILDMSGIAQKGGPVHSHVRLLPRLLLTAGHLPTAAKLAEQQAAVVLACDGVVATAADALLRMGPATQVMLNQGNNPTAAVLKNRSWEYPSEQVLTVLQATAGKTKVFQLDAQNTAVALLGDAIYTNPIMLGFAWQRGCLPLSLAALQQAIVLNGTQIDNNLAAFEYGRLAAHDAAALAALVKDKQPAQVMVFKALETLAGVVADRLLRLTDYQNAAYAKRYSDLVAKVQRAEAALPPLPLGEGRGLAGGFATHALRPANREDGKSEGGEGGSKNSERLSLAVAKYLYKLMAIKDEYEVARLYSTPEFKAQLAAQFEGTGTLKLHLAPPLLGKVDHLGKPIKQAFNAAWMLPAFKVLVGCKGLRGTALDVFGKTAERRMERELLADYEAVITKLISGLNASNLALAVQIASLPDEVRGFGHVKEAAVDNYRAKQALFLGQWSSF